MSTKPSLTLRRRLAAPPAKVYDAWTDPAKMMRWFGPEQAQTLRAETEEEAMAPVVSKVSNEVQIRKLIDEWASAFRAKNIDGLMANHSPDIVLFDVPSPLQYRGADAYRKNWEQWLPTLEGPIGYEIRELSVTAGDDVAFSHSLNRISGTRTSGEAIDVWVRATVGYRKIDGEWCVTHEHVSVPFYMDTGKAACDLEP